MRLIALYHIIFNKWWINEICDKTMCFHIAYFCSLGSQNPASIEQIFIFFFKWFKKKHRITEKYAFLIISGVFTVLYGFNICS